MANADAIQDGKDTETFSKLIKGLEQEFIKLFNRGDAPRLVDMYTEDGQVLPPNLEPSTGREALERLFKDFWNEGFTVIDLKTIEVEGSGSTAYEIGTYTLEGKRKADPKDRGKYIVIWKKQGKDWKLHRDIFNSSQPLPAPESPNPIKRP